MCANVYKVVDLILRNDYLGIKLYVGNESRKSECLFCIWTLGSDYMLHKGNIHSVIAWQEDTWGLKLIVSVRDELILKLGGALGIPFLAEH